MFKSFVRVFLTVLKKTHFFYRHEDFIDDKLSLTLKEITTEKCRNAGVNNNNKMFY